MAPKETDVTRNIMTRVENTHSTSSLRTNKNSHDHPSRHGTISISSLKSTTRHPPSQSQLVNLEGDNDYDDDHTAAISKQHQQQHLLLSPYRRRMTRFNLDHNDIDLERGMVSPESSQTNSKNEKSHHHNHPATTTPQSTTTTLIESKNSTCHHPNTSSTPKKNKNLTKNNNEKENKDYHDDDDEDNDDFDFALVLQSHKSYSYWADRLDFRNELTDKSAAAVVTSSVLSEKQNDGDDDGDDSSSIGPLYNHVNKKNPNHSYISLGGGTSSSLESTSHILSTPPPTTTSTTLSNNTAPNLYHHHIFSCSRRSLFDRAMDRLTPPRLLRLSLSSTSQQQQQQQQQQHPKTTPSYKRSGSSRRCFISPLSPKNKQPSPKALSLSPPPPPPPPPNNPPSSDTFYPPSNVIPRGIAARSNGMTEFLSALSRGIVLRRHIPHRPSAFVKLISSNGGDDVGIKYVSSEEALWALKEQRVRYNKWGLGNRGNRGRGSGDGLLKRVAEEVEDDDTTIRKDNDGRWSDELLKHNNNNSDNNGQHHHLSSTSSLSDVIPNDVLATRHQRHSHNNIVSNFSSPCICNALLEHHLNEYRYNDHIPTKSIVAVHPGRHADPYHEGEQGSITLRQSSDDCKKKMSFSLVLSRKRISRKEERKGKRRPGLVVSEEGERWCHGVGKVGYFRILDFEAATEGEYWLVFRGFLLLHRDAATGRYAAQRASGFGSYYSKRVQEDIMMMGAEKKKKKKKRKRKGQEVEDFDDEEEDGRQRKRIPPPSDYFLGFKSPGTQIWSRLRQAGLQTQRIYNLDTTQVLIKIRCPAPRLQDVADVLRLHTRQKHPCQDDDDDDNDPPSSSLITTTTSTNNAAAAAARFRSSDRQTIIDYLIKSRIRDSGAELSENTTLGKHIAKRIPLHERDRLDELYNEWVTFWKRQKDDSSKSQIDDIDDDDDSKNDKGNEQKQQQAQSCLSRFLIGSFYQPLDHIQSYYGHAVAFYFAWVQHVTHHLLPLAIIGLIVFIIQLISGDMDHPIRPYFSVVVMIWGFVVMVMWRQRCCYLAHRWGVLNLKKGQEVTRAEFKGDYVVDKITGEWMLEYPPYKRYLKYLISVPITIIFTLSSLFGILTVYANRDALLMNYFSNSNYNTAHRDDITPLTSSAATTTTTLSSSQQETFNNDNSNNNNPFHFRIDLSAILSPPPSLPDNIAYTSTDLKNPTFWILVGGFPLLLGICLPLLNFLFMRFCIFLNDFENYRTASDYQSHLIVKVFSFRFVCYFAALYYYAFASSFNGSDAEVRNGIVRVAASLFVYVTVAHWWNVLITIFLPLWVHRGRSWWERRRLKKEVEILERWKEEGEKEGRSRRGRKMKGNSVVVSAKYHEEIDEDDDLAEMEAWIANRRVLLWQASSPIWEEAKLPNYNSFQDYVLLVIQFGYITCFSVVLPITPLIVMINNLFTMRLDAFKLCRGRRRPLAHKTGGIGVWEHVLHIVTVISVLTNCSSMALSGGQLRRLGDSIGTFNLLLLVVAWEHVMLFVKYILQAAISPMPQSVIDDIKREEYQRERKQKSLMRAKNDRRSTFANSTTNSTSNTNINCASNTIVEPCTNSSSVAVCHDYYENRTKNRMHSVCEAGTTTTTKHQQDLTDPSIDGTTTGHDTITASLRHQNDIPPTNKYDDDDSHDIVISPLQERSINSNYDISNNNINYPSSLRRRRRPTATIQSIDGHNHNLLNDEDNDKTPLSKNNTKNTITTTTTATPLSSSSDQWYNDMTPRQIFNDRLNERNSPAIKDGGLSLTKKDNKKSSTILLSSSSPSNVNETTHNNTFLSSPSLLSPVEDTTSMTANNNKTDKHLSSVLHLQNNDDDDIESNNNYYNNGDNNIIAKTDDDDYDCDDYDDNNDDEEWLATRFSFSKWRRSGEDIFDGRRRRRSGGSTSEARRKRVVAEKIQRQQQQKQQQQSSCASQNIDVNNDDNVYGEDGNSSRGRGGSSSGVCWVNARRRRRKKRMKDDCWDV